MALAIRPITLRAANAFVVRCHRHHPPVRGHKWALAALNSGTLVGVAIAGRPVSRILDQLGWLEILRVATDGTPNACSMLYGACARVGTAMGYQRHEIITYTLADEPGTSLTAAGWWRDRDVRGETWDRPGRSRTDRHPTTDKIRWRAARPTSGSETGAPDAS